MKLAALSLRFFKGNQSDLLQRLEEIYRESEKRARAIGGNLYAFTQNPTIE
jgi:hypothetical protein